ncbi:hypothetical protein DV736_g5702, partial [Chaetothyriales sp. CBS 134916]
MPSFIEGLFERRTPQPRPSSPDTPEAAAISHSEAEDSYERVETAGIAITVTAADGNVEMCEVDETQAERFSEVTATLAALVSTDNADADINDTNHDVAPEPTSKATTPRAAAAARSKISANANTGVWPRKRKANLQKEKISNDNTSPTMTGTTVWKGEIGPDNAVGVDEESGERQWEISKICKIEEDNDGIKTIIVKWKGWKGFWPEEYEAIKTQVPELVESFERALKGEEKKNTRKKRGTKPKGLKPKAEKAENAKKGGEADKNHSYYNNNEDEDD